MSERDRSFLCGVVEGFYGRPWTTDQRRHLFKRLKKLGLNTYLYAPKDDLKHRAKWRVLYNAEESALLESLISSANENGIDFVYALSPGIDIVYSSSKEIKSLQDKLSQVHSLGCSSFALLFDDIEPAMNELDRKEFSSFVLAQITVSNAIYEFLNCPTIFMFCPTEYCESRADPNLDDSDYLKTLGSKLHPNISIMWTGPTVISRFLTLQHIRQVSGVLNRKPLIWDNLYANDYDPNRVFLGPYKGRSVKLKNELSGVLLNPNTKYEANHVPIYTLAEWNKADSDAPNAEEDPNAALESSPEHVAEEVVERGKPCTLYHPLTSLRNAVEDWVSHFTHGPGPTVPPMSTVESKSIGPVIDAETSRTKESVPPPALRTCEGNELLPDLPPPIYSTSPIGSATTVTAQAFPLTEAIIGVIDAHENLKPNLPQTLNSLTAEYSNIMETAAPPSTIVDSVSMRSQQLDEPMDESRSVAKFSIAPSDCPMAEQRRSSREEREGINLASVANFEIENLSLFVDIFYLPFEHGRRGMQMLEEFLWLHKNAQILRSPPTSNRESRAPTPESNRTSNEADEWIRRFDSFQSIIHQLRDLYHFMEHSPNKSLLQEIFPYLWEAQGLIAVVNAILRWMRDGNLTIYPTEAGRWWIVNSDFELWIVSAGLLSDLQKLIVTSPNVCELFAVRCSIPLNVTCYDIRPIQIDTLDKRAIFETMSSKGEKKLVSNILGENPEQSAELFFDRFISPFFRYGVPAHHFLTDEPSDNAELQLSSIVLGVINASSSLKEIRESYIPQYLDKYTKVIQELFAGQSEEIDKRKDLLLSEAGSFPSVTIPEAINKKYPSTFDIRCRDFSNDAVSVRHLVHCVSAALALNGSTGFYTVINANLEGKLELLSRFGLEKIEVASMPGYVIMAHSL